MSIIYSFLSFCLVLFPVPLRLLSVFSFPIQLINLLHVRIPSYVMPF